METTTKAQAYAECSCKTASWAFVSGKHVGREGYVTTAAVFDTSLILKCRNCGTVVNFVATGEFDLAELKANL